MNYPIADLLIRIKNGYQARQKMVLVPYSKIKKSLSDMLVKYGYLKSVKITGEKKKYLELELKYRHKNPAINAIKIISKPGLRIYRPADEIPRVKMGFGITIISTSAGLMTDKQARKTNSGGEVICQVY